MMQRTTSYEERPIPQIHPRVVANALARRSLESPSLETASVLEVGCAYGVSLMAMAARMPNATFVGIDIDGAAIEVAQRRAAEAEISNIRFETADLEAFEPPEASFDFAIAHGLLSWISPRAGDALFELLGRALSPQGMAYVSYDTKPGAAMREALGLG